jgi:hypothetical protein
MKSKNTYPTHEGSIPSARSPFKISPAYNLAYNTWMKCREERIFDARSAEYSRRVSSSVSPSFGPRFLQAVLHRANENISRQGIRQSVDAAATRN